MWTKWLPWRLAIRRMAKSKGFLDPFEMAVQIQKFAQPSEVAAPIELIRLASVLHARGLINSQAIQHNLDWVWPFWVERQFDPNDVAFIPRAFSFSHINLTHRNWTAVGIPGCSRFPIVDPRGLVTPFFDSWSIDSWMVSEAGEVLIPSRLPSISQTLLLDGRLAVASESASGPFHMSSTVEVIGESSLPVCRIRIKGRSNIKGSCVISLRPYNPEGISFIHEISLLEGSHGWRVNGKSNVYLNEAPERYIFSDYQNGDAYHNLPYAKPREKIVCDVGMATAAASYVIEPDQEREIMVEIPLYGQLKMNQMSSHPLIDSQENWQIALQKCAKLKVPDEKFQYLYDAALKSIVLHAPREVYPGPYTYKHFWFRDAVFILHAMLCSGLTSRAEKVIDSSFFSRQMSSGYFHSQDGEWDSNGEVLWILKRFCELTGTQPKPEWKEAIKKAGQWILKKRIKENSGKSHAGLFPPGFSAEHLGPNDYYYWDDFWGAEGLSAAGYFMAYYGENTLAQLFKSESVSFLNRVKESLKEDEERLGNCAMPASPHRRMDSGAIGSLVAGYPLQLWEPKDPRLLKTASFLIDQSFLDGGFFHDMSHSGINPYLTLHIAQILLRSGDARYFEMMKAIADLASPTGQWPEAIHPRTKGGCMGDGQHIWASAEWVLMMRNCFVREEGERLILFSGIPPAWLEKSNEMSFGPAATRFGSIALTLKSEVGRVKASWTSDWFSGEPEIEIRIAGHEPILAQPKQREIEIRKAVSQ